MFSILVLLLLTSKYVESFYLPDHAPVSYCRPSKDSSGSCKSKVDVLVNRLSSVNSLLAFDYSRFDLCMPEHVLYPRENLGQVVFGDRISTSPYLVEFGKDVRCALVCQKNYTHGDASAMERLNFIMDRIKENFMHYWIVDNMPITWCIDVDSKKSGRGTDFGTQCTTGFPLGCHVTEDGQALDACRVYETLKKPEAVYLFNHVDLEITFNPGKGDESARIIAAKVTPRSISHPVVSDLVDCWNPKSRPLELRLPTKESPESVKYSFSVTFKERHDLQWASRWDYILSSISDSSIHWLSIVNSLMVVVFLSILIAVVMLQALRRDIAQYNDPFPGDEVGSVGWKTLAHDVFRPPRHRMLLSVMVGCGCQLLLVLLGTVGVACVGMLSPASRGALPTFILVLFVCLGGAAGYISSKIYKMYGGTQRKLNVLLSGAFVPGLVFCIGFFLNLILWINGSSSAMPFTTLVALVAMWCCVSEPLTFLGAYFGFQQPTIESPTRSSSVERDMSHCNNVSYARCLVGGVLPFAVSFIPVFFILTSIWLNQIYYLFGFLFIVLLLFIITSAETAMLLCYFQLSSGDYRWCWRSFFSSGSVALYFFIYTCYYYWHTLKLDDAASTVLYFGYTIILTFLLFTAAGSIGWIACILFVRKIYTCIKLD